MGEVHPRESPIVGARAATGGCLLWVSILSQQLRNEASMVRIYVHCQEKSFLLWLKKHASYQNFQILSLPVRIGRQ